MHKAEREIIKGNMNAECCDHVLLFAESLSYFLHTTEVITKLWGATHMLSHVTRTAIMTSRFRHRHISYYITHKWM